MIYNGLVTLIVICLVLLAGSAIKVASSVKADDWGFDDDSESDDKKPGPSKFSIFLSLPVVIVSAMILLMSLIAIRVIDFS
ncbi:hypothetical protein WJ24_14405 [Burkholderia vietnamiensis]|uniref:hypothetical protein n=1 Tax=Burkholderia vietnamiensis TaxID=60552 RepID=UPI00076D5D95|nr:hypothetical protein [Burkholderia vietnamiensis]KVG09403.1 hypothetical protein WJ24_14405 [Burkholderia vietnamiensis]MBR8358601.1 hypothetical protein [Burkholderia vietnamiensis]HDR9360294.1 hypothetical protein [Burkholderia vietnamiensis]